MATLCVLAIWIYTFRFVEDVLRAVVTLATIPNAGPSDTASVIPARRQLHAVVGGSFERFVGATARSVLAFKNQLGIYYHEESMIAGRYGVPEIGYSAKTFSRAEVDSSTSKFSSNNMSM
jgi:hypothetical protein